MSCSHQQHNFFVVTLFSFSLCGHKTYTRIHRLTSIKEEEEEKKTRGIVQFFFSIALPFFLLLPSSALKNMILTFSLRLIIFLSHLFFYYRCFQTLIEFD